MASIERDGFDAALGEALAALELPLGSDARDRLYAHYERLVEANRQFNLTRITTPADAAVKHYADSLSLLATPWVDPARPLRVLDLGTGAGFPAVPLAIACPEWSITAIDGTGKKVRFVAECAGALGLAGLVARHARGEDLIRGGGVRFDLVLVRAVGKVAPVLELSAPLLDRGGAVVFYKSAGADEEELRAGQAEAARRKLLVQEQALELPLAGETLQRRLLRYSRAGRP
jgi:16S rRNA (guanine527-N7)-methyltransferase